MSNVLLLLFHLLTIAARLIRPGGYRSVIAENLLLKQQLIIHSRSRQRYANRDILDIEEINSLTCAPMSHPSVERLIGSVRLELK